MNLSRYADRAGVLGAVVAALCCAGNAYIISALSAVGILAVRKDAILWPVMLVSLTIGVWGFWRGWRVHGQFLPLVLGTVGALSVAAGVIAVHGFPAIQMIYGGSLVMAVALLMNFSARRVAQASRARSA